MARASGRSSAPTRAGTTSSTALPGKGRSAARRRRRSGSWKLSPSTSTCSRRTSGRNLFPLGHVGIGTHLVPHAVRKRLPWRWLALGCLLPDVIDKPIWLVAQWLGAASEHFDTARVIRHTALLAPSAVFAPCVRGFRLHQTGRSGLVMDAGLASEQHRTGGRRKRSRRIHLFRRRLDVAPCATRGL